MRPLVTWFPAAVSMEEEIADRFWVAEAAERLTFALHAAITPLC